jgi:hypothetical protein
MRSAAPVQPQRRARRHHRQAVVRLARPRMAHAGGVVPHLVEVGEAAAGRRDGVVQAAVGVAVRAVEDHRRRRGPVAVPVLAHALDVAVEAAGGDDHRAGRGFEGLAILLADAAAAADDAVAGQQRLDALAETDLQVRAARMTFQRGDQAQRQFAPGAPDDVEARHRVAGRVEAALDPVRRGQEADAARAQPESDIVVAALHIGLGPGIRPAVGRVEFAEGAPVGQRQFRRVADAGAALFGRADQEDAAEAFLRQAAEVLRLVAVQQQHPASGFEQFQRGADAGNAAADDDDIAHSMPLRFFRVYPEMPPSPSWQRRVETAKLLSSHDFDESARAAGLPAAGFSCLPQLMAQEPPRRRLRRQCACGARPRQGNSRCGGTHASRPTRPTATPGCLPLVA